MKDLILAGPGWIDGAQFVVRLALGAFFAFSGYHKLFNKARHESLIQTLIKCKVPWIGFNQWFVPAVEFLGGIALVIGLATIPAAALLMIICMVAICTDGAERVKLWNPIDRADLVDDYLYLPEVLYAVLLFIIICVGPGAISVDAILHRVL